MTSVNREGTRASGTGAASEPAEAAKPPTPKQVSATLKNGGLFLNRLEEIDPKKGGLPTAVVDQLRALDPNGKFPLTSDEFDSLDPAKQQEIAQLLAGADLHLAQGASKDESKRRGGRTASNIRSGGVLSEADARRVDEKGAFSIHNISDLYLSDVLSKRGGSKNFMTALFGELHAEKRPESFRAFRAFEID
ncbi:MAG: hypothetical protein AAFY60_13690, partial [Myxococcota bacterium]